MSKMFGIKKNGAEKRAYVAPEIRVKRFSVENVITTSSGGTMNVQNVYDGSDAEKYDGGSFK